METESDSGDPESDDGSMIGGNDLSNRYGIVPIGSSLSVTRAGNTASRATHRHMFPVWGHAYTNISEYGFVTLVDDFLTLSYITVLVRIQRPRSLWACNFSVQMALSNVQPMGGASQYLSCTGASEKIVL
jgi:hypothetical protein